MLPYHRRDALSELLTDADAPPLRHLAEQGMGANTLRAIASDPRLPRALGARRHRRRPALAGISGARGQVRRPSPVGPCQARERPRARMPGEVAASLKRQGALKAEGPMRRAR